MNKCEGCKRAVRQEGEGAMCFNCYLAKNVPLPTAQEIEEDDYSTDQVARMHDRIAELEAENAKLREASQAMMDADGVISYAAAEKAVKALLQEKGE